MAIKLIENLSSRGVQFAVVGDVVQFRGARSVITPLDVATLKEHRGEVVRFLRSRAATQATATPDLSAYRQTFGGHKVTWTGKSVSLDEWRRMSQWERHGSTGKMWNGLTQEWESKP